MLAFRRDQTLVIALVYGQESSLTQPVGRIRRRALWRSLALGRGRGRLWLGRGGRQHHLAALCRRIEVPDLVESALHTRA